MRGLLLANRVARNTPRACDAHSVKPQLFQLGKSALGSPGRGERAWATQKKRGCEQGTHGRCHPTAAMPQQPSACPGWPTVDGHSAERQLSQRREGPGCAPAAWQPACSAAGLKDEPGKQCNLGQREGRALPAACIAGSCGALTRQISIVIQPEQLQLWKRAGAAPRLWQRPAKALPRQVELDKSAAARGARHEVGHSVHCSLPGAGDHSAAGAGFAHVMFASSGARLPRACARVGSQGSTVSFMAQPQLLQASRWGCGCSEAAASGVEGRRSNSHSQ